MVEYRKLYGGIEPEDEVRAGTTFDIRNWLGRQRVNN